MYEPSKQEFLTLARQGNTIPVYRTLLADHLTPAAGLGWHPTGRGGRRRANRELPIPPKNV